MYVKSGDSGMTFSRGEYSIPANYMGNAFTRDEIQAETNTDGTDHPPAPSQAGSEAADESHAMRIREEASGETEDTGIREVGSFASDDLLIAVLILLMFMNREADSAKSAVMVLILARLLFGS